MSYSGGKMLRKWIILLITLSVLIPGCTEPQSLIENDNDEVPLRLSFKANTLDRSEDQGSEFDLSLELERSPVLLLWVGSGCSGCHDWTNMIREGLDNGSLNQSSLTVISVHRWANFEGGEEVMDAFGVDTNESSYTPWKIVMAKEDTPALEFFSQDETGFGVYDAYGNPNTPTLQLIGDNGIKMWQSKSYWANYTILDEIWDIAEKL